MKLKLIALGALLSFSSTGLILSSEEKEIIIKMPSEQILRGYIHAHLGSVDFVEKTNIAKRVATKQLSPSDFIQAVDLSLNEYAPQFLMENKVPYTILYSLKVQTTIKPYLYEALLKDNPAALDQLEKLGLYKNPRK